MRSRIVSGLTSALYLGFMIGASTVAAAGTSGTGVVLSPLVSPPYTLSTLTGEHKGKRSGMLAGHTLDHVRRR